MEDRVSNGGPSKDRISNYAAGMKLLTVARPVCDPGESATKFGLADR